jgi:uncharacterized protein (DUF488 family)
MAKRLFTIGYEGISLDSFVNHLKNFAIDCVIDVRETPISRKKGFSKSELTETLSRENIRYLHLRELGSPRPIRERLKRDYDYRLFFKNIENHLAKQKDAIEIAYSHVARNTCCLLCFEHHAEKCHRKLVAEKIQERDSNGLQIINL